MLDLTKTLDLPPFEIKTPEGELKTFDALKLFYDFKDLDGVEDPITIRDKVNEVLDLDVSAIVAVQVIKTLATFVSEHGDILKNVLGDLPFSNTTTLESDSESIKNSISESSTD